MQLSRRRGEQVLELRLRGLLRYGRKSRLQLAAESSEDVQLHILSMDLAVQFGLLFIHCPTEILGKTCCFGAIPEVVHRFAALHDQPAHHRRDVVRRLPRGEPGLQGLLELVPSPEDVLRVLVELGARLQHLGPLACPVLQGELGENDPVGRLDLRGVTGGVDLGEESGDALLRLAFEDPWQLRQGLLGLLLLVFVSCHSGWVSDRVETTSPSPITSESGLN